MSYTDGYAYDSKANSIVYEDLKKKPALEYEDDQESDVRNWRGEFHNVFDDLDALSKPSSELEKKIAELESTSKELNEMAKPLIEDDLDKELERMAKELLDEEIAFMNRLKAIYDSSGKYIDIKHKCSPPDIKLSEKDKRFKCGCGRKWEIGPGETGSDKWGDPIYGDTWVRTGANRVIKPDIPFRLSLLVMLTCAAAVLSTPILLGFVFGWVWWLAAGIVYSGATAFYVWDE